ncbi:MAG: glycine cleavage system protein GcvH [bacterium]|nr:glycine cleavage system protein GcvH [bacterium]
MEMSETRYAKTHEWARKEGDKVLIGISQHAQDELGDIVYVEVPSVGTRLKTGQSFGVVESVKAASDIYAPVSGEVTAVNERLQDEPGLINQDAEGEGWIITVKDVPEGDWNALMTEADYKATL